MVAFLDLMIGVGALKTWRAKLRQKTANQRVQATRNRSRLTLIEGRK
jgi:hypothetical protein